VVLDDSGAESLPLIKGRAIYRTDRTTIVQTPYIENPYIDEAIRPYIIIRPRKEEYAKPRKGRADTLIIEET